MCLHTFCYARSAIRVNNRSIIVEKIETSQPSASTVTCDSNEGFWAEVQSWLIPQFAGDIYGAVNAPIEDAINSEFTTLVDDYNLDTCGSS